MGTQEPHGAPVSVLVVMLAQVLPDAVDGLHALVPVVAVGVGVAVLVSW